MTGSDAGSGGQPGSSWQLSAELKPSEGKAEETSGAGDPADVVPPAWAAAGQDLRTTVKWMVTAFAVVGGVMFAKGFVSTPDLSWSENTWQLVWAWVVGAVGLFALGLLIFLAVDMLRPNLYELGTLPAEFRTMVNGLPRFYLPSDAPDFDTFLNNYRALQTAEATWRTKLAADQRALDAEDQKLEPLTAALDAAEEEVESAEAASPVVKNRVTAAKARRTRAQKAVDDARGPHDRATLKLQQTKLTYDSITWSLAVYTRARRDLLDRAAYWQSAKGFGPRTRAMVVAAVLAAGCGIGYQLLLADPADDESDSGTAATAPVIGELVRTDTDAGRQLWAALHLDACQSDPFSDRIPVVVSGGAGTDADPYVVSTLPTRTCTASTFTVINEVALVETPTPITITYTPSPTPTPSGSPLLGSTSPVLPQGTATGSP